MATKQIMSVIMTFTSARVSGFGIWGNGSVSTSVCPSLIQHSSCIFSNCMASRGETYCLHSNHECACTPGHCVTSDGTCVRDPRVPQECEVDLHTSCVLSCSGDNTECDYQSHECTCSIGYCKNEEGECVASPATCQRGTPGTCAILGCSASRGRTDCYSGLCFCQEGTCWNEQLQACASPSEAAAILASMSDEAFASLAASRQDYFYSLRSFGVRAKHFSRHFASACALFLAAGLSAAVVVAKVVALRRGTTVGAEPLLAGA